MKKYPSLSLSFSLDSCVNEISECPEGNFKIIRNCTTTSPTICKGCAEEHYFHSGYGEHGGCVPCSQPCGVFYLETRKCETAHDRICTPWNPPTMVGKSKYVHVKNGPSALEMPPRTLFPLLFFTSLYSLICLFISHRSQLWQITTYFWFDLFVKNNS